MTMRGVRLLRRSFQVQTLKRASPSYSSTFIGSRLWNYGSKLQTRRAITSITETKDETVVLEEQDKALASNTATDEDEEDSQEVWVERLKEALRKHESVSLENDKTAWIQSVETVRDCYLHLGSFADALTMEQQLLDVVDAYQDQADSLHRMGSLHLQLQHFDKAKRYYQAALDKFYTIHGHESFHKDMGKLLIGLGGICVHSGNPDQALPYLAQAEEHYRNHGISRHDTEQPDPHPEVTTVLANQAVVHRMLGQHQVAIDKYQEIMAFVEEENAPNKDVKRDELQFQIADCLFTLNQLSPALDHFETLLDNEIVRRGQEESSHEGVLRHFIGVIHCKQGRMEEALRQLESAYVIKKATLGEVHPEVASTLNGLGAVHATLGNDGEALSYFRESLMIARIHAVDGDDKDPQVMQTLRNISLVHGDKVPKWN